MFWEKCKALWEQGKSSVWKHSMKGIPFHAKMNLAWNQGLLEAVLRRVKTEQGGLPNFLYLEFDLFKLYYLGKKLVDNHFSITFKHKYWCVC